MAAPLHRYNEGAARAGRPARLPVPALPSVTSATISTAFCRNNSERSGQGRAGRGPEELETEPGIEAKHKAEELLSQQRHTFVSWLKMPVRLIQSPATRLGTKALTNRL